MAESLSGAAIAIPGGGGLMSEPESHAQKIDCRGYVFDDFTLDLDRGCLWRAGQEVKLRYKSFEALRYLVERSGRVVGKDLRHVTVRPTSAVRKYVGGEANPPNPVAAGQELDVESVLEGSIRRSGERIRVTVQLINVRDGTPLWAEKFDEKFTDILTVQDAVAEHVSQALLLQLTGAERMLLTKRYTNNPEAYQHYLKGRYFLTRRTESGYQKCIESFQQAIKLDQGYAPAYAGLADAYNIMGLYVFALSYPREVFPKAKEAAGQALKIDSELGEAHSALAFAKLNYDWDWAEVEREFNRAIELKPDDANLQHYYSHYWMARGQVEKSLAASRRALELGQFELAPLNAHLGWHYLHAREYDRAVEQLLKTIELDLNFVTSYLYLGLAYEQKGMNYAAIAQFSKAAAISSDGRRPVMEAALGHAYAVAGKRAEAQRLLDGSKRDSQRQFVSPYGVALIYVGLGDKEQAFAWLNRAYDERDNWLNYLKVEPRLDPLRSDARFTDLLGRVGLSP